ncbi:MAG: GAF domain-containing sensor histidine kinase [Deinococcus sp.]|nr:GAF domain-containing sensor histidine kinase [Deinococcus sp.]
MRRGDQTLHQRILWVRQLLPPTIVVVVGLYTAMLNLLSGSLGPVGTMALEVLFFAGVGPIVTYWVLGWVAKEVAQREELTRRLEVLSATSQRIARTGNIQELLDLAAALPIDLVGANGTVVCLLRGGGRLSVVRPQELPQEEELLAKLQPLLADDHGLSPQQLSYTGASYLVLPLRWSGRAIGAILLAGVIEGHRELELLTTIAGALAGALEGVRLRTQELLTLFEVDRSLRAEPNLDRQLERVLAQTMQVTGARGGLIMLQDEESELLRLRTCLGLDPASTPATLSPRGSVADALAAGRATPIDPLVGGLPLGAAILVPMQVEGRVIGLMLLHHPDQAAFDRGRLELLAAVADRTALVIRNAQLYVYTEEFAIAEERSRIAREIHDGVAQNLAFLMLKVDLARRLLNRAPELVDRELELIKQTLRSSISEVRRSIFALRPIDLERHGFYGALEKFVREFDEQTGITIHLEVSGERQRLGPKLELVLFRVLQEALNNVAKHSGASRAQVTLTLGSQVALAVQDQGRGFDPSQTAEGVGLLQMRERTAARGGKLEIRSAPGQGTTVRALFQVAPEEPETSAQQAASTPSAYTK